MAITLQNALNTARNTAARALSSYGTLTGVPNLGISQKIAGAAKAVQPYLGMQPLPSLRVQASGPAVGSMGPQMQNQYNTTISSSPIPDNTNKTPYNPGNGSGVVLGTNTGDTGNRISDQLNSGNDQIERDYQSFLGQLQGQEDALRSQQPISQQKVEAGYAPAITAVKEQQATKVAGLDSSASTVEQQRQSQLQQARDLYRQIQQQNIAQLSGMGISSSSVAEALAENLGVETARRIASSSQSADDVIRQIDRERINVNEFAKQKLTDIETQKAAAIAEIQSQFAQGLNQINQARQIAANDKANRRQDLLSQAQQAAYQIEQNAQNFQQSLQMWQAQAQQGLANAANQDWSSIFGQLTSNLPQIGTLTSQLGQVGLQPSFDISNGGKLSMSINSKKKQDDPTAEAF